MEVKELKPSNKPQDVNSRLWYYESGKHLSLCVDIQNVTSPIMSHRIAASKLLKSLSRIYGVDLVAYIKEQKK
jgi:hypothetical protein